jgi:hypothetical protein
MSDPAANGYSIAVAALQFLGSLAWPAAILIALVLFKKDLQKLLPFTHLKYGDSEVSFRFNRAEHDAAALAQRAEQPAPPQTPEELTRFDRLADISPQAAILEQRRELEQELLNKVEEVIGSPPKKSMTFSNAVRTLREREIIDPHLSGLLDDLRNLGNAAAHGNSELTKDDAAKYRDLANSAITFLKHW